jgi:hypothetical protein
MEVMDACINGRFVHMGYGYYIIDRNGNDVIIGFDGTRTPAPVHQEGRTAMDTYYSVRKMLTSTLSTPVSEQFGNMRDKSSTDKWIEDARKNGHILHTNGAYTVIYNCGSVIWIHAEGDAGPMRNTYAVRHGYVYVEYMDKYSSWKYLQNNSRYDLAKELETFSW